MTSAADLPFKLIQEIVTISAWTSLKQAAILARISHHIHDLIRPILFRTFVHWCQQSSWPGRFDPGWFKSNGGYIRSLLFCDFNLSQSLSVILESCPNLTNIAILQDISEDDLPSLLTFRPHRLAMHINGFFKGPFRRKHAYLPMFINLTHLDIMKVYDSDWQSLEGIQYLPELTHLSLSLDSIADGVPMTSIVQNTLEYCKRLAVLILCTTGINAWEVLEVSLPSDFQDINSDPRVVSLEYSYVRDWEVCSKGGRDKWTIAEEIVKRRTSDEAPDLPFELIQEIFTISAWSSSKQAAILARVSSDIYHLIKPILFRTFVYWNDDKHTWPGQFDPGWLVSYGKYASNLLFSDEASMESLPLILESCPNLTNIALWLEVSKDYVPSLLTLRPHQLSIYLIEFFGGRFQETHAKLPMFTNLTHLDLAGMGDYAGWYYMEGVQYLPRLTHLSLSLEWGLEPSIVRNVLQHCKLLAILVLFEETDKTDEIVTKTPLQPEIQDIGDPRVVSFKCAYLKEWELGSQGGRNMWVLAEEVVKRRSSTGVL
ncbi:hypothetical protein BDN72DRAFT_965046 [Pluteus cervinus]|uniref:Uncharacterized protein n=1 Tax=Pluteus cervinus TaxID=181527 RepID=A0ACD3A8C8_9AGAR|nr:hypothetical protein BDN72DRAFT_965046 [Pluteus cervinus]